MPTYIALLNFTEQGIKNIQGLPARIAAGRQLIESKGGKLNSYFLTMGQYDAVAIIEAPDEETIAAVAITTAGQGNLRTTTIRAFTEEEIPSVIDKLP